MSRITNTWNHTKGVCAISGKPTDNVIRLNTTGYCSSSESVWVCEEYIKHQWVGDTLFCTIDNQVFWEINCDWGGEGVVEVVRNKEHFDYLVNRNKNEFLRAAKFSCDFN